MTYVGGVVEMPRNAWKRQSVQERRIAVFVAIMEWWERKHYGPSLRGLQAVTGIASVSTVRYHVNWLSEKGLVSSDDGVARSVTPTDAGGFVHLLGRPG